RPSCDAAIGARNTLFRDLPSLRRTRIQGHAELVAVHRQEHRAAASHRFIGWPGADRDQAAILAAADPLDADNLGAEIAEERRAERPRDIAPEIENADSPQDTRTENAGHRNPPACYHWPVSPSGARHPRSGAASRIPRPDRRAIPGRRPPRYTRAARRTARPDNAARDPSPMRARPFVDGARSGRRGRARTGRS